MDKIEKIRQEIERRREANKRQYLSSNGGMSWQRMVGEEDCLVELLTFLDTLSEEPDRPEPYTGKYDEAYLNEKIKKASEHWKGVDVDKMLAECRGYDEEPDKSLEEAAEKKYPVYWKNYPKDGIARSELSYDTNKQCREAFIAGAERMEKEINKELIKAMEKVHEIRDVDYDIHVDTSANGSFNRLNIIQNEK